MTQAFREWLLHEEIGRGGMGVVFRATHKFVPGDFALKLVKPELLRDAEVRERFLREAATACRLRHPNIVETLPPVESEQGLALPMELLAGAPLDELLRQRPGPWGWEEALAIVRQAAAGLGHAHASGVLHRDVKPANLFVLQDGGVKLVDFGLAKGLGDRSVTASGLAVGTPVYIAPEILHGKRATAAADVYALGVVLYRLLAGRLPIDLPEEDSLIAVVLAVAQAHQQGLPPVRAFVRGVPPWLDALCSRMLSAAPETRPADGAAVGKLLEAQAAPEEAAAEASTPEVDAGAKTAVRSETHFAVPTLGAARKPPAPETPSAASGSATADEPRVAGGGPSPPEDPASTPAEPPRKRRVLPAVLGVLVVVGGLGGAAYASWWQAQVRAAADAADCGRARGRGDAAAWQVYLDAHPGGACAQEAAAAKEQAAADEKACDEAQLKDDRESWDVYLKAWAEGSCASRARERLAELDRAEAAKPLYYKVDLGDSPWRGSTDALVTIVEWADFQCPYCARVNETLERLLEEYGGNLRHVFKHNPLPFHQEAMPAAIASLAAHRQGRFWELYNLLFENHRALSSEQYQRWARQIGLDMRRFRADLEDAALRRAIEAEQAAGVAIGANGTPTFFINGRELMGAQPYEKFKEVIDEELARGYALLRTGVPRAHVYAKLTQEGLTRAVKTE